MTALAATAIASRPTVWVKWTPHPLKGRLWGFKGTICGFGEVSTRHGLAKVQGIIHPMDKTENKILPKMVLIWQINKNPTHQNVNW